MKTAIPIRLGQENQCQRMVTAVVKRQKHKKNCLKISYVKKIFQERDYYLKIFITVNGQTIRFLLQLNLLLLF